MRRAPRTDRRATGAAAADDAVEESDLDDPTPDVHELFRHYDALYFRGALGAAGFAVKWGSPPVSSSFGSCTFSKPSNTITLSEPVLQYRSCADLKNALLHEMIHAIIYLKHHRKDCTTHGPVFRDWLNAINSCCIKDPQRPVSGYNITTRHDFKPERSLGFKGILWQCELCGHTLLRATNVGAPSAACCIENVTDKNATCGNMLCPWHNHKSECRGSYGSTGFQSFEAVQNKVPEGTQLLLTYKSETSKLKGAIQESNSAELQEHTEVTEQNAEDEHVSLNSLMKKAKRCRSGAVQEAIVLAVEPPKEMKREQALVAMEKLRHFYTVGCNDARSLEVGTLKKTGKQHKPEDVQKANAPPATDLGKPQLNQQLVPTERHKLFSLEGCSNGKPVESSSFQKTGKSQRSEVVKASILPDEPPKEMKQASISKEGFSDAETLGSTDAEKIRKQHKPEDVQRPSAPPATSQGRPKLTHEFVTTGMQKILSLEACNYAKSPGSNTSKQDDDQHKPTSAQKDCSYHAYSLRRLKKDPVALEKNELIHSMGSSHEKLLDKSSSKKTRKRNEPEDIQETTMLQTVPRHKPKKSSSAPRKQQRKCRRQPARKKEYAVVSLWMNIYESDRSSGSTEPLVNKRTERRKRERERIQATANSHPPLDNSWMDVSVSSHKMGKDESALESRPSSPYCNAVVLSTVQQVVTRAAGGRSQTSAPCLAVVPLQPADAPLDSIPLDSAIIDISDDD